jgi:hypothetical protein
MGNFPAVGIEDGLGYTSRWCIAEGFRRNLKMQQRSSGRLQKYSEDWDS